MQSKHCPECGAAVSAGAGFCPACGSTLGQPAGQRRTLPLVILGLGAAFLLVGLLFLFTSRLPEPAPAAGRPLPATAPDEEGYPDVPRILVTDALALYEQGAAVFVDTRARSLYDERHIPGAVWLPTSEVEARYQELDPAATIITYCT